ncbi:MAG: transcriptional repressor [Reichenbachiella sp.]
MKNSRNTAGKQAVLELLESSSSARSHKEILTDLNGLCDRVTVYRILDRLIDDNVIHKFVDLNGVTHYAVCQKCEEHNHHHNHVHFTCTQCESVVCLEDVEPVVKIPTGYQVHQSSFTLSGLCPDCSS